MKTTSILLMLFAAVGLMTIQGCGSKHKKVESETLMINTEGKQEFKLENISGKITLSPGEIENQIKIIATKTVNVRKKDLQKPFTEIEINVDSLGNAITVNTEIKKRGGIFKFNQEAKVDYQIFLPDDILTNIYNVNGSITGNDLTNNFVIEVVNGSITLNDCTGELKLETVNGKIKCNMVETSGVNISTINGSVEIGIPNSVNANISAKYQNGSFVYDEMSFKDVVQQSKTLSARLGGPSQINISAETVNGKISFIDYKGSKKVDTEITIEKIEKELKEAEEVLKKKQKELEELKSTLKDTTSI